jgi:hypothetical protein
MTTKTVRTESRELWPFAHSDGTFDTSSLRLAPTEDFDPSRNKFALEDEQLDDAIQYEFKLDVDASSLVRTVQLDARDIEVVIVRENDDGKRRVALHRYPLSKLPRNLDGTIRPEDYSRRRLVLRLVAALKTGRQLGGRASVAWRQGSILAQRAFVIGPAPDTLFKVHWSPFAERGWEKEAISYVELRDPRLLGADVEVDEVLQVHLNSDLPLLVAIWKAGATRDTRYGPFVASFRPLVAAELLHELAVVVTRYVAGLRKVEADYDLEDLDPASFAARVLTGLARALGSSKEELFQEAMEDPERLRVRVQDVVGVGRGFTRTVLERWER